MTTSPFREAPARCDECEARRKASADFWSNDRPMVVIRGVFRHDGYVGCPGCNLFQTPRLSEPCTGGTQYYETKRSWLTFWRTERVHVGGCPWSATVPAHYHLKCSRCAMPWVMLTRAADEALVDAKKIPPLDAKKPEKKGKAK